MRVIKEFKEREVIEGGGIYAFYSFDKFDIHKKGVYKIGLTTNFQKRIGSYHTYLPEGMYFQAFLQNPSLKRNGREDASYYLAIEKEIFHRVEELGGEVVKMEIRKTNNLRTEWIYTNQATIDIAFREADIKYSGKKGRLLEYNLLGKNGIEKQTEARLKKNEPLFTGEIVFF